MSACKTRNGSTDGNTVLLLNCCVQKEIQIGEEVRSLYLQLLEVKEQLVATVKSANFPLAELYPEDYARALVPPPDGPQLPSPTWHCMLTGLSLAPPSHAPPASQGLSKLVLAEPAKGATSSMQPFEPTAKSAMPTHLPLLYQQHLDAVDGQVKERWGRLLTDLAGIQGLCSGGYKESGWKKPGSPFLNTLFRHLQL